MATCSITSATLTAPSKDNVYLQKANVVYNVVASVPESSFSTPEEGAVSRESSSKGGGDNDNWWEKQTKYSQSRSRYTYSYDAETLVYNWTFSPGGSATGNTGTTSIDSLNIGASNEIYGTVTVTCSQYTQYQVASRSGTISESYIRQKNEETGKWGDWILIGSSNTWSYAGWSGWINSGDKTTTTNYGEASQKTNVLTVYTRPGSFTDYNFSADTIIQSPDGLTATKVGNWINHCNQYAHWYNQNAEDVTTAACSATSGSIITAAWYNACANAIPIEGDNPAVANVTGGVNGTIITADIINALGAAISKGDT